MNIFSAKNISFFIGALIIGVLLFATYRLHTQKQELQTKVAGLEGKLKMSEKNLEEVAHNARSLLEALETEQQKSAFLKEQSDTFGTAVQRLSGTVTNLEKRTQTDPELLIKYSKVYFLNENYTPERLALIPKEVVQDEKEAYYHARALPFLENLLKEAKAAVAELKIISGYRSFETQRDLKSAYKVVFGSGANKFSSDQGYSEHQLGTAVDFTTPALGTTFEKFDTTAGFKWLTENAYRFGFILSYPKSNAYYIYEPWHWRFVGVELATRLHDENRHFYDMDQRNINEYLAKIFD